MLPSSSSSSVANILTLIATVSTWLATLASLVAVWTHLKHYIQPGLQRWVIRILWMVPIYSITAWGSLKFPGSGPYLDIFRDVYEAFVIYCFVSLLIAYMDGERAFLTVMYNRAPVPLFWPLSIVKKELDLSDPYDYLFLKRGILQYVVVKPITALMIILCAPIGLYAEGDWSLTNLYPWVQLTYNISVSLSLYCLVIFYTATAEDLAPWRPLSKFLCVKAIVFFSYWQGFGLSILVGLGIIHDSDSITAEYIASYLQAWLICVEMLGASWGHWYSFSYKDYVPSYKHAARMRLPYAIVDALGLSDVIRDVHDAYSGTQYTYQFFEPVAAVDDLDVPMPVAAPPRRAAKSASDQAQALTTTSSTSSLPSLSSSVRDDEELHEEGAQPAGTSSSGDSSHPSTAAENRLARLTPGTSKKVKENRLRAGMRYINGGTQTYWLPVTRSNTGRLMAANAQLGHNSPLKALRAMGHHRSRREREAHALYQGNLTRSSRNQAGLGGDDDQQQHEQYVYQSSMLYPVPPKLVKVRHNPDGSQTYLSASDNEGDDATNELHKLDFEQDALSDPSTDELFNEARSVEGDYNYPVIELGVVFGYGRRASYEQLPRHRQASAGASIPPPTSDSSGRLTREHRLNYGSIV